MNSKEHLTIATANNMFGGMAVREFQGEASVTDWLFMHGRMLMAPSETYAAEKLAANDRNPTKELLEIYNPDIIVLSEVIPDFKDKSIRTLRDNGYHTVIGRAPHVTPPLTRAVVIASKFPGEEIDFTIPGDAGGGSCGMKIPELGVIVLAPHPSAFNKKIRADQLRFTANKVKQLRSEYPDYQLVITGDFNVEGRRLDPYFSEMGLTRHSLPSFPRNSVMKSLNKGQWVWLRNTLNLQHGPRDLDHIFVPDSWSNTQLVSHQTTSDHLALVFRKI